MCETILWSKCYKPSVCKLPLLNCQLSCQFKDSESNRNAHNQSVYAHPVACNNQWVISFWFPGYLLLVPSPDHYKSVNIYICDVLTFIFCTRSCIWTACLRTNKLHSQWLWTFELKWTESAKRFVICTCSSLFMKDTATQCLYAVSTVLQTSQTIKWCNLTSHWSRPVPAWMTQPSSASHYQAPITLNRITDQSFIMYSAALPHFDQLCQDSAAAHRKSNPRALVFVLAPPVDKKQGNNIKP